MMNFHHITSNECHILSKKEYLTTSLFKLLSDDIGTFINFFVLCEFFL